ncbi:MAG: MarR family transcriptional regulator [Lachnospiraceae bacterium]|jgi:Transcriptional regulators|nr:MarR family transcriptional regulator [Lachnospiraceae bacterium]
MNDTLHYLLMADHALLQKILFANIRDSGLSLGQPKVLDFLKDHDGAVQKDIAKGCHIEPASLSTILTGMEKSGLITRETNENNRRNLYIYMTDKGKAICEQVTEHFSQIEKKALSGFTEEEIENILTYLTKIHKNLEA